jgi:hypothetical protein
MKSTMRRMVCIMGGRGVGSCCPDPKQPGPCVSRSQFLCFDPKRWLN